MPANGRWDLIRRLKVKKVYRLAHVWIRSIDFKTVELHLSGRWLSGSPVIRTGLFFRVNMSRILQNKLAF